MRNAFSIHASTGSASIELSQPEFSPRLGGVRFVQVKLQSDGVCAWGRVELERPEELAAFFEEIGWPGGRTAWTASEAGDLLLAAEVDRYGFVAITATLVCRHPDRDWYVKATVDISFADLQRLADQARVFLNLPASPASDTWPRHSSPYSSRS